MIIISERINGLFKSVEKAIAAKDAKKIQELAIEQVEAGANYLDINTGPGVDNAAEVMVWLINAIQEVVDVPLCIDTADIKTMSAGLNAVKGRKMINSTTAEEEKMNALFPLAKEYDAEIICLTLNKKGIPNDANGRCELALQMITKAMEYEISIENIYLDPLVLPISAAQDQGPKVMEALSMFKTLCEPPPKTVVGLSNISNNTKERELINKTYIIMLMAHGLDAAIINPKDEGMINAIKTAEILLNKKLYCDSYLRA